MQKGLQGEPALPNEDAYYEEEGRKRTRPLSNMRLR
jgi:hypothetical protein